MHEPATTITDYLLALECAWFAMSLAKTRGGDFVRRAFIVLFAAAALAALAGGTVHGFFPDRASTGNRALWVLTLLSVGLTAAAMLAVAARTPPTRDVPRGPAMRVVVAVSLAWLAYAGVVLFVSREFVVAIAAYLPSALVLMAVLAGRWLRDRSTAAAAGIGGVVLALLGAAGQQLGLAVHPMHFDHNAVYHVVQMGALYLLFVCARGLAAGGAGRASDVAA